MRQLILILSLCIIVYGCNKRIPIERKFKEIQSADYSSASGFEIDMDMRHWTRYIVTFDNNTFLVWHGSLWNRAKVKEIAVWEDSVVVLPYSRLAELENAIGKMVDLSLNCLRVDEFCNVYLKLYWNDQCIYDFIRVQPGYSLDDVKERFHLDEDYVLYEDNWYVHKECKECKGR